MSRAETGVSRPTGQTFQHWGVPNNGNAGVATYDAVLANGGAITLDQTITIQKFNLSSGILAGSPNLTLNDNLTRSGGTMSGGGATSVAGLGSTISSASSKFLGRVLTNTGTMTESVADTTNPLLFGPDAITPGVLNNSGTFNVTAGGDFSQSNANANHAINSGTWNVSGAGFSSNVNFGIKFNNTGTVIVSSGTFSLSGTTVQYSSNTLSAGIWQVFAGATLNLPTSGTGIITNQADITLSGAGSVFRAGASSATLDGQLTTNSGAWRILSGRIFTATNGITISGLLQLGGGTFGGPSLTNSSSGELFGFGSVTVRPANSGLIRAAGGTLTFSNGIQGGSGTVQIDAGSVLNLSGGAASGSSADFLVHNGDTAGSLNLGTKTFTAGVDYTNANFGVGNPFNPRANVSGAGQILAFGGTGQSVSGNVASGGSATPVMAFGNMRLGAAPATLNYQINNTGASGSSLRGAVQTSVNGGNLTDARLSGAGVTSGNFGPLLPGASTGNLAVAFNPTTPGALTGQAIRLLNNFDNVTDQTLSLTGAVYRLAAFRLATVASLTGGGRGAL